MLSDAGRGQGKRSGARVHYYYVPHRRTVYLMYVYLKHEQQALTPEQKRKLCALLRRLA